MHGDFVAVSGTFTHEYSIEKSRFIASCHYSAEEADALSAIEGTRQRYKDATHVCYGYVTDNGIMRFSDDGEPSKTAGLPILEVIRSRGLKNTLVTVTRYFGGIKLGAGGLVRAYSAGACGVLDKAGTKTYVYCKIYELQAGYSDHEGAERIINSCGARVTARDFSHGVTLSFAVPKSLEESCLKALGELYRGDALLKKLGEGYVAA